MAIDSNALDAFKESGGRPLQPFDPRGDNPRGDDSRGDAFKESTKTRQRIDKGSEEMRRPQPSDLRGSGNMTSTSKPQPFDLQESGNNMISAPTDSRIR